MAEKKQLTKEEMELAKKKREKEKAEREEAILNALTPNQREKYLRDKTLRDQATSRIQAAEAKARTTERKQRTRQLILLGTLLEKAVRNDPKLCSDMRALALGGYLDVADYDVVEPILNLI